MILTVVIAGAAFAQEPPATMPAPQQPEPPPVNTPAKVKTPSPYDSSDSAISIAPFYWFDHATPIMRSGRAHAVTDNPSTLDFPGKAKSAPGIIVSVPAGENNAIRASYFRVQSKTGGLTSTQGLNFFGTSYDQGTQLSPKYTLQNAKISLDYTSWPFPLKDSRFRFKTLWELQYTSFQSTISAPVLEASDATLSPAKKGNWFFYPTFGVGIEEPLSKHLRFEAKASGFAFPKRAATWDADALLAYRMGPIEIFGGYKGYYFKTSPKQVEYVRATLQGAYAGIRWYPKF